MTCSGCIGYEPLICADDAEAVEKAKRLINGLDIEVWNGGRFVAKLVGQHPNQPG